ncbi:condensation domain-containing protein [Kitasatospora sp. NBC_01539]|uniref:condensation domain-containing protein n=1 Tax=Kitasatospora sp. NBC_01539 TaxID=2903577 RepID=UPI0038600C17
METRPAGSADFHGGRAGSAPMTWGQRAIWKSIKWLDEGAHYFNISRTLDLPDGLTYDQVTAAVGLLVLRHEVLRTRFHDDDRGPTQEVDAEGALPVPVLDTSAADPATVAADLARELAGRAFRHDTEWPVRCSLVLDRGRPAHLALVFSHLGADFSGVREALADLRELLAGRVGPVPAWQPLDQARHETEGIGAARGAASLEYWRRTLRSVPAAMFPAVVETEGETETGTEADPGSAAGAGAGTTGTAGADAERFVRLRLDSPALAVAATRIADRCQVSTGTVLLAATAAVLGACTGHGIVALQLIAVNRHDDRSRHLVAAMAENALFALDVGSGTFDDAVRRTFLAGMNAYRFAQYDPLAMDDVLAEAREAAGGRLELGSFFNDKRMHDRWSDLPDTGDSPEALRALAGKSEVTFVGAWERQDAVFFVHTAYDPGSCLLHLMADTRLVPRPAIERVLLAFERLLVDAALGPVDLDGYAIPTG